MFVALLGVSGCGRKAPPPLPGEIAPKQLKDGEEEVVVKEPTPKPTIKIPESKEIPFDPKQPLNVRVIQLDPIRHLDEERIFDLSRVTPFRRVPKRLANAYPLPVDKAARAYCRVGDQEAEVEMVVRPDTEADLSDWGDKKRVRARVVAAFGPNQKVILEPIVILKDIQTQAKDRVALPVIAGFDFSKSSLVIGKQRTCSVAFLAPFEVPSSANKPMSLTLSCAGATGEHWIEMTLPARERNVLLTLDRGSRVMVRIESEGGFSAAQTLFVRRVDDSVDVLEQLTD